MTHGTCYVCHVKLGDEVELEFFLSEDHPLIAKAFICDECWISIVKPAASRVDVQADRREEFEEAFFGPDVAYIRKWSVGGPS